MAEQNTKRCKHPGCNCMAAGDSSYCSPHCETVKSGSEIVCQCGHPQCSGTMK
jgi:hypothetical protein